MSIIASDLLGTGLLQFLLGRTTTIKLVNATGSLEIRDEADALVNVRAADPLISTDVVPLGYADIRYGIYTIVEKDLGTLQASGAFDITGLSGLTAETPVYIQQSPGPYTGKDGADEAEMSPLWVTGSVFDATTIRCYWTSLAGTVSGNFKFFYRVGV